MTAVGPMGYPGVSKETSYESLESKSRLAPLKWAL
jgi:hypothetical protein